MDNRNRNSFSSEDVRRFWDSVADIYDEANARVQTVHKQRYHEAIKYLPRSDGLKILNVWSRTGGALEILEPVKKSSTIINLEVSFELIRKAVSRGRSGLCAQTSLKNLPVKPGSFDVVLSLETLEHCPDPRKFISEIRRALKQDGVLIMSCPPAFAEVFLRIYSRFASGHGEGPHKFLPSRMVKRFLSDGGFELLEHKGTVFLPFENRVIRKLDGIVTTPLNSLGLSDLGIRQFYHAKKVGME